MVAKIYSNNKWKFSSLHVTLLGPCGVKPHPRDWHLSASWGPSIRPPLCREAPASRTAIVTPDHCCTNSRQKNVSDLQKFKTQEFHKKKTDQRKLSSGVFVNYWKAPKARRRGMARPLAPLSAFCGRWATIIIFHTKIDLRGGGGREDPFSIVQRLHK